MRVAGHSVQGPCRFIENARRGRILLYFASRGEPHMNQNLTAACLVAAAIAVPHARTAPVDAPRAPTVDQILSLKRAGAPAISPDGRWIAYTVRRANWDDNAYETDVWMADVRSGATRQLTAGQKSSSSPAWSPDGSRLAFISDRTDKRQIYLINPHAGEAEALTSVDEGVANFAWSPDGTRIAYTATEPKLPRVAEREKKYGELEVIDQEPRMTRLFVIDAAARTTRTLTPESFVVGSFDWSPDGREIVFDHVIDSDPANSGTADIAIVTVADAKMRDLVTQAGPDRHPVWSPDGSRVAFQSAMANPGFEYTNTVIATVPAAGGAVTVLTAAFDEDPSIVAWKPGGVYFAASEHTWSHLYRLDPASKAIAKLAPTADAVDSSFSMSSDGSAVAFLHADAKAMAEVYTGRVNAGADLRVPAHGNAGADRGAGADLRVGPNGHGDPSLQDIKKVTDLNAQTAGWITSTLEIVSWKSQDGTTIEGVLHKPVDFNPARRYPLLIVIHGGPTGVSRAVPFTSATYPIDVWVPRGVLVLEPNYRGSSGYGGKFRALNVRNLGIGDAWDVLSGIDALVAKGIVDPARVGTMGWSQGGYISAFLATHDSTRFKAISVGAGISDWTTYYVNTDIHQFTRQYLKATPWDDPAIYAKTSPITYIKQAKTPTLIQHGAADQRVPLPNAFELYQGLQDQHVPVKLIVYRGFGGVGHGPSKPKSYRATMDHNLEWFDQYLFEAPARPSTAGR
jgi:dipeptidyl aminopeptidase/acylaminoacyl peptidase